MSERRYVLRRKSDGLYWRLKDDGESDYNRLGLASTFSWTPLAGDLEEDEEAIPVRVTIEEESAALRAPEGEKYG